MRLMMTWNWKKLRQPIENSIVGSPDEHRDKICLPSYQAQRVNVWRLCDCISRTLELSLEWAFWIRRFAWFKYVVERREISTDSDSELFYHATCLKSSDVGTRDAIGSKMRFQYIQELPSYKFFFGNVLLWILGVVIIFNMTHGYMQLSSLTHL